MLYEVSIYQVLKIEQTFLWGRQREKLRKAKLYARPLLKRTAMAVANESSDLDMRYVRVCDRNQCKLPMELLHHHA